MTELERCELAKAKGYTYDPITGYIIGVRGNPIIAQVFGYVRCQIKNNKKSHSVQAHRLAWYLHYGKLPKNQIDHIDGNRANNKIDNLRDVTWLENQSNKTKAKGYSWNKEDKRFISYIRANKQYIYLGRYDTAEEARAAYLEAKKKYHIIGQ